MLGLDEAGAGPGFGPLVACAATLQEGHTVEGLADSKVLSEKKRNVLFEALQTQCRFGLGVVTNEEIDEWGMAEARRKVFERALEDFARKYDDFQIRHLIVDGTIFRPWKDVPYTLMAKADQKIPNVSAASILAKVTRDTQMKALCDAEPDLDQKYKIRQNKGYLSKDHIEGIREHGFSRFHRKSYNIRQLQQ